MSRYPLWKYILVILVMVYAVIYTLPNFYETYPSINVTNYENRGISKIELTKLTEDKSISYMGTDGNSIFFESIDDQLSAYNKLSSDQKFKYTLISTEKMGVQVNYMNLSILIIAIAVLSLKVISQS